MVTQKRIRLYSLHNTVAFDMNSTTERVDLDPYGTGNIYLEVKDARAFAKELLAFAEQADKCNRDRKLFSTRIIADGKATNEIDGKSRRRVLP